MTSGTGRVIKCTTCASHLGIFARRARCVFGCGAWYCRRGKACRNSHAQVCSSLKETPVSPAYPPVGDPGSSQVSGSPYPPQEAE